MPAGSILVADDDAAIRTVLSQALSRAGYEVRSTGNAATLGRWISQGDGDLISRDVLLPDESAFDLLPRIKKARPDLPIIVMSAQNTFMTAIRASERGAYEYLPKPFDLKELIAIVGRALSEPKEKPRPAPKSEEFESIPLVGRSPAMQEIYRVLQQGEYTTVGGRTPIKADVRIIAATNKDLRLLIQQGLFREDLFFRLNVVPLRLPPLRERSEDIPDLIRHFFALVEREGLPPKQIDQAAVERLKRHRWPGNVRELENLARRLAALYPQETITAGVVDAELSQPALAAPGDSQGGDENLSNAVERYLARYFSGFDGTLPPPGLYHRILREVEGPLLSAALAATRGNQIRAADLLGVNRNTLRKKIRDLDLQVYRTGGEDPPTFGQKRRREGAGLRETPGLRRHQNKPRKRVN